MKTVYYKIGNVIFRTREDSEEFYIERREDDQWIMDADLLKYIFAGEPGAEEITEAAAME